MENEGERGNFSAVGPAISALPVADRNMQMAVESQGLQRLVPEFFNADEVEIELLLGTKDPIPSDITAVSYTLPEVLEVWFNSYVGAEPSINFPDLVKGIGCAAYMVDVGDLGKVKQLVEELATQVSNGASPPMIDSRFADSVKNSLSVIFNNNEPVSYRSLMAFTLGAFWLLGFVVDPGKKRGSISPLDFVAGFVQHYGQLAYLPT